LILPSPTAFKHQVSPGSLRVTACMFPVDLAYIHHHQ
jgi:hypothetical protein